MRVLIVEDDVALQDQLVRVVKKLSDEVQIDTTENADETITWMDTQRLNPKFGYDLIISDVSLNGKRNGFDLWRVCADRYPETEFLFISGISTMEFLEHLKGDTRSPPFLCKPFTSQQFRDLVTQLLSSKSGVLQNR